MKHSQSILAALLIMKTLHLPSYGGPLDTWRLRTPIVPGTSTSVAYGVARRNRLRILELGRHRLRIFTTDTDFDLYGKHLPIRRHHFRRAWR